MKTRLNIPKNRHALLIGLAIAIFLGIAEFLKAMITMFLTMFTKMPEVWINAMSIFFSVMLLFFVFLKIIICEEPKKKSKGEIMKLDNKELQLRQRNEQMLKFWAEYTVLLMIGLFGAFWIVPEQFKPWVAIPTVVDTIATIVLFIVYTTYHNKTSKMIKEGKFKS